LNGSFSFAKVWASTSEWNEAREVEFSKWVESDQVHLEMASTPKKKYYDQVLDCADLVYYLRAIFSYEHQLEFLARDNEGRDYSSNSNVWDSIKDPEERFRIFLQDVLAETNTSTLNRDSVMVELRRDKIIPGTFLATNNPRVNHVWVIKKIENSGVPELIYATESNPPSSFIYPSLQFPVPELIFQNRLRQNVLSADKGGFRRWLWPQELRDRKSVKIDLSQTKIPLSKFFEVAIQNLAVAPVSFDQIFSRSLDELCLQMRIRSNLVTDAAVLTQSGLPLNFEQRDALSTPERDKRIRSIIQEISQQLQSRMAEVSPASRKKYFNYILNSSSAVGLDDQSNRCLIQWAANRVEPLSVIVRRFNFATSNPEDSLERRWGERD